MLFLPLGLWAGEAGALCVGWWQRKGWEPAGAKLGRWRSSHVGRFCLAEASSTNSGVGDNGQQIPPGHNGFTVRSRETPVTEAYEMQGPSAHDPASADVHNLQDPPPLWVPWVLPGLPFPQGLGVVSHTRSRWDEEARTNS